MIELNEGFEDTEEYKEQYNKTVNTNNYNMQIPMFVDKNGDINIIAKIYAFAGADYYYYIINTNI